MNMEENFGIDNLFLSVRKCRVCSETKDLMDSFYLTHKKSTDAESAYSYECKECTKIRISRNKRLKHSKKNIPLSSDYPDW